MITESKINTFDSLIEKIESQFWEHVSSKERSFEVYEEDSDYSIHIEFGASSICLEETRFSPREYVISYLDINITEFTGTEDEKEEIIQYFKAIKTS